MELYNLNPQAICNFLNTVNPNTIKTGDFKLLPY